MAKVLENVTMFLPGNADITGPGNIFMSYDVVDGKARKQCQIYEFETPVNVNKSPNTLWAEGVAAINSLEGIS